MSQFVNALDQSRAENRRLFILILVLAGVAAGGMYGWYSATRELTVHLPPDLRNGASLHAGEVSEVPAPNVYTFAYYIWQQVNRWQNDGSKDYGDQIYQMQHYLTPSCRSQLMADMTLRHNKGELAKRTRALNEIPGLGYMPERVAIRDKSSWQILLDAQMLETANGQTVKDAYLRYPLRVVRFDIDREKNPFQLALDCFGGERPERLDPKSVEVAQRDRTMAVAVKQTAAAGSTLDVAPGTRVPASNPASAHGGGSPSGTSVAPGPEPTLEPVVLPAPRAGASQ